MVNYLKQRSIKFFCTIVCCSLFLLSCESKEKDSKFALNLDVVMNENDSICVFYTTDGTIDFSNNKSFWVKVNGKGKNQKINVLFPDSVIPNQVRLDFASDGQQEIILNKVEFKFNGNSFKAEGKSIYKYFRINESNTTLDEGTGILKRKDSTIYLGPSLYPNGFNLAVKLEELKYQKKK